MKKWRYEGSYLCYFLMYMFYYFGMALFSALISVYLMGKGYSASQVSVVVSAGLIMSMALQPFAGSLSDRMDKKKVNSALLIISAVMGLAFLHAGSLPLIAITYSLGLSLMNCSNPVIERLVTTSRHRYSAIRIWGAIGYATGSQAGGWIYSHISPESMYRFFALSMVLCVIGLMGSREDRPIAAPETADEGLRSRLRITKELLIYLVIVCLFYGMTNVNGVYIPAMFQSEGLTVDQASLVLFLGTMMELPVILLSRFYMNTLSNKLLLQLSFILLLIQFGAYAFTGIVPLQIAVTVLTKSVSTMAFIMINIRIIDTIVDAQHQITALALVSTVKSLVSVVFQAAGGLIIDRAGYGRLYAVLFICSAAALLLSTLAPIKNSERKLFS